MSNIAEDYNILRSQVSQDTLDNVQLKLLFKENNYNIVDTLIEIERKYFNNNTYINNSKIQKTEAQEKIEVLRNIVNSKDKMMENIKLNAGK